VCDPVGAQPLALRRALAAYNFLHSQLLDNDFNDETKGILIAPAPVYTLHVIPFLA
jgi:hypothetical protein